MPGTYILVDKDQLNNITLQIEELKRLFRSYIKETVIDQESQLMDSADVISYLKITRKTLYKYRKHGLPSVRKANGKLYFWRKDVNEFLMKG